MKSTWRAISNILGAKQHSRNKIKISKDGYTPVTALETATEFNSFFSSIGANVAQKIPETQTHVTTYLSGSYPNSLLLSQFGFRSQKSTNDAIVSLLDLIFSALDKTEFPFGLFIDLKKVFDTANHNYRLLKLHHYGVRGLPMNYMRSYLSDTTICSHQ
ncbi:uncharacterized protein [Procambarus clarkii]|uniref:uncharacterized protein n=1 Tax=Procambarus clarkii TaxID=6728 RepID=UPI003743B9C4